MTADVLLSGYDVPTKCLLNMDLRSCIIAAFGLGQVREASIAVEMRLLWRFIGCQNAENGSKSTPVPLPPRL